MVERAKNHGIQVSLITNGTLLTEDIADRLIDIGLDCLSVSIDGASPECYADVRLGDALPVVLENLKTLQRLQYKRFGYSPCTFQPRLGIAYVAMRRNLHDLPHLVRLGVSLVASEFFITNVLAHNLDLRSESLYHSSLDQVGSQNNKRWKNLIQMPKMDISPKTVEVLGELLYGLRA
jgi:MoaA/NifB/PqqE/SkfB family radical SAM enzyme